MPKGPTIVRNIKQLREILPTKTNGDSSRGYFRLLLAGGICFSSKDITRYPDNTYCIYNGIDDTYEDDITEKQLLDYLGEAMKKNCLVFMDYC